MSWLMECKVSAMKGLSLPGHELVGACHCDESSLGVPAIQLGMSKAICRIPFQRYASLVPPILWSYMDETPLTRPISSLPSR